MGKLTDTVKIDLLIMALKQIHVATESLTIRNHIEKVLVKVGSKI